MPFEENRDLVHALARLRFRAAAVVHAALLDGDHVQPQSPCEVVVQRPQRMLSVSLATAAVVKQDRLLPLIEPIERVLELPWVVLVSDRYLPGRRLTILAKRSDGS